MLLLLLFPLLPILLLLGMLPAGSSFPIMVLATLVGCLASYLAYIREEKRYREWHIRFKKKVARSYSRAHPEHPDYLLYRRPDDYEEIVRANRIAYFAKDLTAEERIAEARQKLATPNEKEGDYDK